MDLTLNKLEDKNFMKYIASLVFISIFISCKQPSSLPLKAFQAHAIPNNISLLEQPCMTWHQDTLYCNGNKFSGYGYTLFPNGDTTSLEGFWNGLQEGETKKWYNNRQLAEYRTYIEGKKEGIHQAWWLNGKPKFLFGVSNDEYCDSLKEWNSEGLLTKFFHYKNGQEEGSQRLWWEDGKVRANYVIKNGKKYGLTGVKLCSNPYDSIK